ncbi:alpha-mannosidase [Dysgonomonas reticulitermitis]
MKKILMIFLIGLPLIGIAQPTSLRAPYNITKGRVLYTIGYTHLDTQWNWDYPTTINQYIKRTMTGNFALFEKYPDFVFNFSGSRRYAMMKEYYPNLYSQLKDYVAAGRWYVGSACVDEGEVNISSSESIMRQVLYGNLFYKHEFGKTVIDYMLPDCFGFVATVPSVLSHAGVLGFSTQKLTWKSATPIPFNVGLWEGPDKKSVIAALNATNYAGRIPIRLDLDSAWIVRLDNDISKYGLHFDYRYYGIGDRGGAPRDEDVQNLMNSLHNKDSKIRVLLTSSDQMYRDITPTIRRKMPIYRGDLLLIEHSAGSLTSQSFLKRMNRKNEVAAKVAEQVAVMADWTGTMPYPFTKFNAAWNLLLGSQMHDILPGTAIPSAYEYTWNDEFIVANHFASTLTGAISSISHNLDTRVEGRAVVVYNPVTTARTDVVNVSLPVSGDVCGIQVKDPQGNIVPSQITKRNTGLIDFIFIASVPASSLTVFDVQPVSNTLMDALDDLKITLSGLENEYYSVKVAANGDLASIYDKKVGKELLAHPASLEFLRESPVQWPAWNMDWADRQKPPIGTMSNNVFIKIIENGPVRVALEINRGGENSKIAQIVSLASGKAGQRVEIWNCIDWQSRGVSLKASFPLTVSNAEATYSLDNAAVRRGNNNERKFEVPSRQWFDLTNRSGDYGVTILEDCRYGSDKPNDNTMRLTLMYTPVANVDRFTYQATQDFGIHNFKYGLYGHSGNWDSSSAWQAKFLNQPLLAFEVAKHAGQLGNNVSMVAPSSHQVDVMAFKKAEEGDYYIVRLNELTGHEAKGISVGFFAPVAEAFEVNGQEEQIGKAVVRDGKLETDMEAFAIRSFAVRFARIDAPLVSLEQKQLAIEYNADVVSANGSRSDGQIDGEGYTLPAEQLPSQISSEGIVFTLGNTKDGAKNAIECRGQVINLPAFGQNGKLFLLAMAETDSRGWFSVDGHATELAIQGWNGFVGQHYGQVIVDDSTRYKMLSIEEPYAKTDNIAWFASHYHTPQGDASYKYCYIYKYCLDLPVGAHTLILPNNPSIKIMAITASTTSEEATPLQKLYDDFADYPHFNLRRTEPKPTQAHR